MRRHLFRCYCRVPLLVIILGAARETSAETLVTKSSTWRYRKGTQEASDPRTDWRTPDFDDSGWSKGKAPLGYGESGLNTTLSDMQNSYSSFFIRRTFTVTELTAETRLRAVAEYDDGFIMWINGERVWDRNEPDGTPLYDSLASGSHERGTSVTNELPDPKDYLEPGENLLAVQVFNAAPDSSDCWIDVELGAFKRVADTAFAPDRGFYDAPFDVTIRTKTPGATIRYTTNGTAPSSAYGTTGGTNVVVHISDTRCLRAAAFKSGYEPTDVDTHTYIFLDGVLQQAAVPAGFPATWGAKKTPADYAMDAHIVDEPAYAGKWRAAFKSLPTMSIVLKTQDMFGTYTLYGNTETTETPCSVELIYPEGFPAAYTGFQVDAGLKGHSHAPPSRIKRSLKLFFRGAYGAKKLNYPLFETSIFHADSATDTFDGLILRAGGNETYSGYMVDYRTAVYARDEWARNSFIDMMGYGCRGMHVHLYINGLYWGVYNPVERMDETFHAQYFGGEDEDWFWANQTDAAEGYSATDPADDRWEYLVETLGGKDMTVAADYAEMQEYLRLPEFCDYVQLWWFTGGGDWQDGWGVNNMYYANRINPPEPGFYLAWDLEWAWLDSPNLCHDGAWIKPQFLTAAEGSSTPYDPVKHKHFAKPFRSLMRNKDFRMLFADRLYKHVKNDGMLTDANSRARWTTICDFIEEPILCEGARWGDAKCPQTYDNGSAADTTVYRYARDLNDYTGNPCDAKGNALTNWYSARDHVYNLMGGNGARLISLCKTQSINGYTPYPSLDPPTFQQHGGAVASGFRLTLSNPNGAGAIYYTLDGSDPRLPGGAQAGGAALYSGARVLSRTTHVKARIYKNADTWSPVHAATFNFTAHYSNLRITEILYNPLGGEDFEFIEIKNTGSSTRGLSEMTVRGIRYTFPPGAELGPGEFAVLVRNEAAFTGRHPGVKETVALFGEYSGKLSNDGEKLALLDNDGRTVTSVRYNDKEPWPREADGAGFSLVAADTAGDQDDPAKWRASNLIGGSPGRDDGAPHHVVISEVLSHTDLPQLDAIELHNAGGAAADIGGWYLSDSNDNYRKYRIPDGTTLAADQYIVFDESDFNTNTNDPACFALDSHGDEVYLTKWDSNGNLEYLAEARFGGAENGVAFARYVKTDEDADFVAQRVPNTLGSANAPPKVGPLVINEILYNPVPGAAEFIELANTSGSTLKLYDPATPANRWRLAAAVDYTFPAGTELAADETVLVVSTNESTFRAQYPDVPSGVRVFGPYAGRLGNGGESVKLWRPGAPDEQGVPWILADRVQYGDNSPWPESADGDGPALERQDPEAYGNDAVNWTASLEPGGTPGRPNSGVLVPKSAGWRYHDQGADLGTAWRLPGFDDSRWQDGNAPLGYDHLEVDTVVSYGDDPNNKPITTYFRKRFTLAADPADVESLDLAAKYDDGFVVYLNGQEVARKAVPGGTVSCTTPASSHSATDYEPVNLDSHIGKLVQGVNVLAVELHQSGPTSSDLFMDIELVHEAVEPSVPPPAAPGNLTAAALGCSEIKLTWQDNSDNETTFKIDRSLDGASWTRITEPAANTTTCTDAGLAGDTRYYYRVKAYNSGGNSDYANVASDKTDPAAPPPPIAFTAYNDLMWDSGQPTQNITTYSAWSYNGWSTSGPLVDYERGTNVSATLTVSSDGAVSPSHLAQGADAATGTDAHTVFAGKVSAVGNMAYGTVTLHFTGLDPALTYELVLYGNRNESAYTDRTSVFTISDVQAFANQSTAGTTIGTTSTADDTITIVTGSNTQNGHVARFAGIDPGADGDLTVTIAGTHAYVNALMLRAFNVHGSEPKVPRGAVWRYRKGTAEASAPVSAWRVVGFDDSAWSSGAAPFGYGDGPYGTTLADMEDTYSSVFLRTIFVVDNPSLVNGVELGAFYDDGFVMWINGREVARVNVAGVPGSPVAHDGFAAGNMGPVEWSTNLTGSALTGLRQGENVLAVQAFNVSLTSSDLSFDAQLSIVNSQLPIQEDADQDGMPDAWETACLSNLADPADRADWADPDGDGLSNLEEFIAGTDPTGSGSSFEVDVSLHGGQLVVEFQARAAAGAGYDGYTRHYALESRAGTAAPWEPVPGYADILGAGQTVSYTNATPEEATYYLGRVWLENQ
ncbi:MAG: lamin tail domain-containing protein [Kiritimatiellae bacterium]|nr:lamin tail domain-containing protein [Kiritimatiellia bacterium]